MTLMRSNTLRRCRRSTRPAGRRSANPWAPSAMRRACGERELDGSTVIVTCSPARASQKRSTASRKRAGVVVGDGHRQGQVAAWRDVEAGGEGVVEEQVAPAHVGGVDVGRRRDRTGTGCTHSSEPQPVTQNGSGEASKRACRPARRRSPRSLTAASAAAPTRSSATTAPTAIVKALLLNVPAWLRPPRAGSNAAIRSARPPKAPNDSPPPRYLPSVVMSGVMPSSCLGAADAEARRHHLVEDQHRAGGRGQPAECGEEVGVAGDAAAGALHRLDEHAGDVGARAAANSASAAAMSLYGSTA